MIFLPGCVCGTFQDTAGPWGSLEGCGGDTLGLQSPRAGWNPTFSSSNVTPGSAGMTTWPWVQTVSPLQDSLLAFGTAQGSFLIPSYPRELRDQTSSRQVSDRNQHKTTKSRLPNQSQV